MNINPSDHLDWAKSIIPFRRCRGMEQEDIEQTAYLGLCIAASKQGSFRGGVIGYLKSRILYECKLAKRQNFRITNWDKNFTNRKLLKLKKYLRKTQNIDEKDVPFFESICNDAYPKGKGYQNQSRYYVGLSLVNFISLDECGIDTEQAEDVQDEQDRNHVDTEYLVMLMRKAEKKLDFRERLLFNMALNGQKYSHIDMAKRWKVTRQRSYQIEQDMYRKVRTYILKITNFDEI